MRVLKNLCCNENSKIYHVSWKLAVRGYLNDSWIHPNIPLKKWREGNEEKISRQE